MREKKFSDQLKTVSDTDKVEYTKIHDLEQFVKDLEDLKERREKVIMKLERDRPIEGKRRKREFFLAEK